MLSPRTWECLALVNSLALPIRVGSIRFTSVCEHSHYYMCRWTLAMVHLILANLISMKYYPIVVLICIFMITNVAEYIFIFLLAIWKF